MGYAKKPQITTKDLLEAYKAHGDSFVIIDVTDKRDYKTFCNYLNVSIKLANGNVVKSPYCSFNSDGIATSRDLVEPSMRQYEQLRFAFAMTDEPNDNLEAMKILCNSFINVWNKMVENKIITHRREDTRKKNSTGKVPVLLISTEPKTPMQTTTVNKATKDTEELENPVFWVNIPKKKYRKGMNSLPKQFGDVCYKDEDGADGDQFMIQDFNIAFYDIEQGYFDSKTGNQMFRLLGDTGADGNIIMNNTNIHQYVPENSLIFGAFEFEVKVASRGAKLDLSLYGSCHVKMGEEITSEVNSPLDLAAFAAKCNVKSKKKNTKASDNKEDDEEEANTDNEAEAADEEKEAADEEKEAAEESEDSDEYISD